MAEFEDKLNSILGNQAAMNQIMALARSLSGDQPESPSTPEGTEENGAETYSPVTEESGSPAPDLSALMGQIEKGYQARCAWAGENGEFLQVTYREPERAPSEGTEFLLTFERASRALRSAEVSVAGETVLTAEFTNFTMEEQQDDTGDGA